MFFIHFKSNPICLIRFQLYVRFTVHKIIQTKLFLMFVQIQNDIKFFDQFILSLIWTEFGRKKAELEL